MTDDLIGRTLADRFDVIERIGEGGMGTVYRAHQRSLDRFVAVKTVRRDVLDDERRVQRFFREAAAIARMSHSNTVRVFDFGQEEDGTCWLAMEYLEGHSLQDVIEEHAPLEAARVIHIAEQVAEALHEAHSAGVIHRDIKPGNIMLVKQGDDPDHVKVVDFGLVKELDDDSFADGTHSTGGKLTGSPQYISPEQIVGGEADARSDIYALGVVMFYALTGSLPWPAKNVAQLVYSHVHAEVPAMSDVWDAPPVPEVLERLVRRCLAKKPDDRFADAMVLATTLHRMARKLGGTVALRSAQGVARPRPVPSDFALDLSLEGPTLHERAQSAMASPQRRWLVGGLVALVVLLSAALLLSLN